MDSFTNRSIDVIVLNQEKIDYEIISKDEKTGIIDISLSFKDASNISSGSEPDILEVSLN